MLWCCVECVLELTASAARIMPGNNMHNWWINFIACVVSVKIESSLHLELFQLGPFFVRFFPVFRISKIGNRDNERK